MPSTLDALKQVSGGLIRKMSSQEVANTLYGICICICICICRTNDDWVAWLTEAFLFYYVPALSSVRISTVFQHCRRAFLLCSSTQCCTQCTHCYCIPALCACIPTIFKHFSGCIYTRLYVKCSGSNSFKNKRHGPIRNPFDKMDCFGLLLGCWASSEHCERLDVLRTIATL